MPLVTRKYSRSEKSQVMKHSREVRTRRSKLRIRQKELDFEAGVKPRTVERIERRNVDWRSMPPEDPSIEAVLSALSRLEADSARRDTLISESRYRVNLSRRSNPIHRPRDAAPKPTKLSALVKWCPQREVWITQGGCVGRLKVDPVCNSMRGGQGCRGVKHRNLKSKRIDVEYTPPTPSEIEAIPPKYHAGGG